MNEAKVEEVIGNALRRLPTDKQEALIDFAEFLVQKTHPTAQPRHAARARFIARFIDTPLETPFTPLTRDETHSR